MGRLLAYCAKQALLGEKVDVVNCEKAVITGTRRFTIEKYKHALSRGTYWGPHYPRRPDLFLKRIARGMIPYRVEKGELAMKRLMFYLGVPEEFKDKKMETVKPASISKLPTLKYMTIQDLCHELGRKE